MALPRLPGGRTGASLTSQATKHPPHPSIRLLPQLRSPGSSTCPALGGSPGRQRMEHTEGKWFPIQASCWRQTLGRGHRRSRFPPFATQVCSGGEHQGPGSSLLQVKAERGEKKQSQLRRRATKPAWSRQPPHIREDSSQKHPQAVPLLPRQSLVSMRRDDTPLPGASQPASSQSQARRAALRAATRSQQRVTPLGKGPASSVQT